MRKILAGALCGLVFLVMIATCVYNPDIPREGVEWKKGAISGKPTKNKPVFVTKAYYHTDEDFRKALCEKVAWLEDKGYKIRLIKPVYGKDLTQKEIIMYYIVYYREKKNGTKKKESD